MVATTSKDSTDSLLQRYGSRVAAVLFAVGLITLFQHLGQRLDAGRPDHSDPIHDQQDVDTSNGQCRTR